MNRQRAESITMEFIGLIDDVAEAVRIAGSIRREKPEVKDAEVVLMPTAALYDFAPVDEQPMDQPRLL